MSYRMDDDGGIEFTCQCCGTTRRTRQHKAVPPGWYISGVLRMTHEDLDGAAPELGPELDAELVASVNGHWCSKKCAEEVLLSPEIRAKMEEAGLCVVLYGKAEMVIDATRGPKRERTHPEDEPEAEGRPRPQRGSRDDDEEEGERGKGGRGGKPNDPDKPRRGSPPPLMWDDGRSPI